MTGPVTDVDRVLDEARARLDEVTAAVAVWHSEPDNPVLAPVRVHAVLDAVKQLDATSAAVSRARDLLVAEIGTDEHARAVGAGGLVAGWHEQTGEDAS